MNGDRVAYYSLRPSCSRFYSAAPAVWTHIRFLELWDLATGVVVACVPRLFQAETVAFLPSRAHTFVEESGVRAKSTSVV